MEWGKKLLKYEPPKIDKQILKEVFKIYYQGDEYLINLSINKSKKGLPQGKPTGESGILFYYGKYSVLDFTFLRFDRDVSFSKFFGEAKLDIERLIRDPDEAPLVDEKRRGLDPEHLFNKILFGEMNKRLKEIQQEEEISEYSLDEKTKKDIIRELNKLYKNIKGRGLPPEPKIKPEIFEFHKPYISIEEYEPKTISLIINSGIVFNKLEICLKSTNPSITSKPTIIKIERNKIKEDYIIRHVELYSEKADVKGEIIATSTNPKYSTKIGIEVLENPMFSPLNGFAFVPDKTKIVDDGGKKVNLCIDKSIINSKEITFTSEEPINCPGKQILPDIENLEKHLIKNIIKIELPIKVKGAGHIGETANITASYDGRASILNVKVVTEPSISGFLRDIRPSPKETEKISYFNEDTGILEIYYKHSLLKKYMRKKNFNARPGFLVFYADIVTREVARAIVLSGIKENLAKYDIFDIDNPQPERERHINLEYYEQGPKMHGMFIKLGRTFRI